MAGSGSYERELGAIKRILSADFGCHPGDFDRDGVFFCNHEQRPGRRRFPFRPQAASLVTMGRSVIVTAGEQHRDWLRNELEGLDREELFALPVLTKLAEYARAQGMRLYGPHQKYVCFAADFRPAAALSLAVAELRRFGPEQMEQLYGCAGFPNALSYRPNHERPDVLAVAAFIGDKPVGIAGASEDGDGIVQVGVDVLEAYRRRGIGTTLVSELTQSLLEQGRLVYYTTSLSNLSSSNTAIRLGYKLVWLEIHIRT